MNESNNHYGKKLIIVFFNKSPMGNAFIFFFFMRTNEPFN